MELHVLIYKIVSLRLVCGNYEDSSSFRDKLEAETINRIRRLRDLENKSELEVAQSLCDLYQEKFDEMPARYAMGETRRPRPVRTILSV
jgi:hypothetical protein